MSGLPAFVPLDPISDSLSSTISWAFSPCVDDGFLVRVSAGKHGPGLDRKKHVIELSEARHGYLPPDSASPIPRAVRIKHSGRPGPDPVFI